MLSDKRKASVEKEGKTEPILQKFIEDRRAQAPRGGQAREGDELRVRRRTRSLKAVSRRV